MSNYRAKKVMSTEAEKIGQGGQFSCS